MSIVVNSLSYVHPDRESLFQNISLSIAAGEKAALVGSNGAGKSTLLQVIAGNLQPAEGELILSEKPYYVPQHLGQYDACSIAQVLQVDQKLGALHAILDGDVSPDNFTMLNDDWTIDERVAIALSYWKLAHLSLSQNLNSLSGGEKTKVFLAGILIHSPGIILLDEPSNHLDSASRELLYDLIRTNKATSLVVSHDRMLLNLLNTTLELSKGGIEVYGGNYDFYKEQKEGKLHALQAQVDEKQKSLKQAQQKARDVAEQRQKQEARGKVQGQKQSLPRIIAGGRKSQAEQSTAKLKDVQAEKINDLSDNLKQTRAQLHESQALKIDLRKSDLHSGKILIEAKGINFAYGDRPLWQSPLSFQVRSGDRIRIEGNNGSGKTTLLSLMMGRLQPTVGGISIADFQYVYIDQEYSMLDNQLSVFEQVQQFNTRHLLEHELKMMLHYYQFPREAWDRKCADLSGGEKMKLTLCCLAVRTNSPDVLILDEPTNNLDMSSQEILTRAVKDFTGSILVISHDQYFINEIQAESTIRLYS
ncbi:ATP-binding cassette domain-containing protein [Spirosoma sp. HMF4905]|uniref:ATP-binding cassette domain-containing protein n=1 Tax=Spirosoma arboris TaxID=2682092 RepID=A0A7K1SIX2_9BACT|nr:ABC-F family ATP-binding cassette domain-containing protein [Spirosoma arboris]MVM33771.1 ATP-binding cassette domain-containing protein [Spirosoma arboris]